ncbi:MAG: NAD(P)/FAD-dependent oxidoreductase [Planctomycetaceae bacterium]
MSPAAAHSDVLPATIAPADAAGATWQVVVVGAGPAGAAVAGRLAARGIRTLLVDRHEFPRTKVCGCCLSSRALRELRGVDDGLVAGAVALEAVRLAHRGGGVRIPMPAGRVLSRETLDARLVRHAIAAGCHWLPGVHVAAVDDDAATPRIAIDAADRGPLAISAEFVVLATGLADHVRIGGRGAAGSAAARRIDPGSRIGVGGTLPAAACGLPAGEPVMAVGRGGYCGLVRLEDGRIDVAAAIDRHAVARDGDLVGAVARLLDEAATREAGSLPDAAAIRAAPFRATPPLTRRAPCVAGRSRRILRAGDAAGYVEPFTGEGIGWALASGRMLVESMLTARGLRAPAETAARHAAAQRGEFAAAHLRCRLVARGLRRPTLVAAAVAAARAMPWAARRIVPAVIGAGAGDDA